MPARARKPIKIERFRKRGQDIPFCRRTVQGGLGQEGEEHGSMEHGENAESQPVLRAPCSRLLRRQAAVDREHLAGDVGGRVAGQVQHGVGDFVGLAQPLGGDPFL